MRLVSEEDLLDCLLDVNPGLVRAGYTTRVPQFVEGEPMILPWSVFTDRRGERFDYAQTAPQTVTISCTNSDGDSLIDTWSW